MTQEEKERHRMKRKRNILQKQTSENTNFHERRFRTKKKPVVRAKLNPRDYYPSDTEME